MKTCTKCGVSKEVSFFYRQAAAKDGLQTQCKACHGAMVLAWKADHVERRREIGRASMKKSRHQNPKPRTKEDADRQKKWRSENPDRFKELCRRNGAKRVAELRESYVRAILANGLGAQKSIFPAPMVEAKRAHLQLKRIIKELK